MASASAWWETFFDADYIRIWGPRCAPGDEEAAALWRILALSAASRVLDAPCGYGRVSLPLARLGASVLGVDRSAELLEEAERRRGDLGRERLRYLLHDLRAPLAESGFDAALNLATSLGYGTEEDDVAILRTLAAAVRPGGVVAIETIHRDAVAAMLAHQPSPACRLPDGTLVFEEPRLDPVAGRMESTSYWFGPAGSGQKTASIRAYALTELVRLLERAGLRVRAALHPGSGTPFQASGPFFGGRVLLVAESSRWCSTPPPSS
ncbi:MAG TPA: class I SAM-dependent methyltransferase [Anaeromyxobacteraceae bacterium]|nr:class I SAM-dependent methyltransferase [Anaeromyxobacteraceae bacterium]